MFHAVNGVTKLKRFALFRNTSRPRKTSNAARFSKTQIACKNHKIKLSNINQPRKEYPTTRACLNPKMHKLYKNARNARIDTKCTECTECTECAECARCRYSAGVCLNAAVGELYSRPRSIRPFCGISYSGQELVFLSLSRRVRLE